MRRHATDVISLVAGVLFITLGVMFALDRTGTVTIDVTWIPAIVLVGLGLAGIASGVRASFDGHSGRHTTPGASDSLS